MDIELKYIKEKITFHMPCNKKNKYLKTNRDKN